MMQAKYWPSLEISGHQSDSTVLLGSSISCLFNLFWHFGQHPRKTSTADLRPSAASACGFQIGTQSRKETLYIHIRRHSVRQSESRRRRRARLATAETQRRLASWLTGHWSRPGMTRFVCQGPANRRVMQETRKLREEPLTSLRRLNFISGVWTRLRVCVRVRVCA